MTMLFTAEINRRQFYGGGDLQDSSFYMINDYTVSAGCIGGGSASGSGSGSGLINISSSSRSPLMADQYHQEEDDQSTYNNNENNNNNLINDDDYQLGEGTANNNSESSSKNVDVPEELDDEGWLQLSIGGGHSRPPLHEDQQKAAAAAAAATATRKGGGGLVELELLPSSSNVQLMMSRSSSAAAAAADHQFVGPMPPQFGRMNFATTPTSSSSTGPPANSFFIQNDLPSQPPHQYHHQYHQDEIINWAFRPPISSIAAAAAAGGSSSSNYNNYYSAGAPFQLYASASSGRLEEDSSNYYYMGGLMGPPPPTTWPRPRPSSSSTTTSTLKDHFRVIPPPKRPHSAGLWFMLQPSLNQEKQPFLPQISKSFLRIKDGRMTIRLVIKYLVNKLTLQNESEIEIRCKGQRLVPFLTLQHVRDNIWSSSTSSRDNNFITLLPNSSTTDHIMVLHYARTTSST